MMIEMVEEVEGEAVLEEDKEVKVDISPIEHKLSATNAPNWGIFNSSAMIGRGIRTILN